MCDRSIVFYMYIYTSCPGLAYLGSILNLIICVTGPQLYYYMYIFTVVPGVNPKPDHMCDRSIVFYMYIYSSCPGLAYLVPILNLIMWVKIRGKIREQKGIDGSLFGDCLSILCCPLCALVQEAQEVCGFLFKENFSCR